MRFGRGSALAAVLLAAMVQVGLGGCASPAAPSGQTTPDVTPELTLIRVPTDLPQPAGTPRACPAALIEGRLVADARWGIALGVEMGVPIRQVIWPFGYAARQDGNRRALIDATGRIVAHEGDRVQIGGGEIRPDGTWLGCGGITVVPGG